MVRVRVGEDKRVAHHERPTTSTFALMLRQAQHRVACGDRRASGFGASSASEPLHRPRWIASHPSDFVSWLGISPREHSTGGKRRLGRISKQGDVYLRMLLTHGARSLLNSARRERSKGQPLDRIRQWAVDLADRIGMNKATIALANKLARRLWAAEHHGTGFDPDHVSVRSAAH